MDGAGGRRFDCQEIAGGASLLTASRRLPYAMDKIAYGGRHGTQGTVPARRRDIGKDADDGRSLAHGRFLSARTRYEAVQFPDPRGVWGQVVPGGSPVIDPHRQPDPSSKATNSCPGTRGDKTWSRRGEAEGDGAARVAARGRSSRSGYKVGSRRSSGAVLPTSGCQEHARVFSGGFPHLV